MEFKKLKEDYGYKIKIEGIWYSLCACATCGTVHAYHEKFELDNVDDEIKCCKHPDNWSYEKGNQDMKVKKANRAIDLFMAKYSKG